MSQAERIKNGVCPNYPRNCRFGDVCKFQHVEPKGKTENLGKPEKQNVRSVGVVKDSQQNSDIEQKLDQITAALTLVAKKLTGVNPPRRRKCIIVTDSLTPAKGSYSSLSLPLSHACVRTCISDSAGKPQSVVGHFRDDIRSVIIGG